jgi:hypothetical protein
VQQDSQCRPRFLLRFHGERFAVAAPFGRLVPIVLHETCSISMHLVSSAIYFSATYTSRPPHHDSYTVLNCAFLNNNDYICHSVHIELRVSAAAAAAAFLASFSGEVLAC